jgi:hypothetical protein
MADWGGSRSLISRRATEVGLELRVLKKVGRLLGLVSLVSLPLSAAADNPPKAPHGKAAPAKRAKPRPKAPEPSPPAAAASPAAKPDTAPPATPSAPVAPSVAPIAPPPAPPSAPVVSAAGVDGEDVASAHAGAGHGGDDSFLTLDAGYDYGDRWYRHSEPTTGEIRSYTALRLNSIAFAATVYPAEKMQLGHWKGVGITLSYAQSLGASSRLSGQTTEAGQSSNTGMLGTSESVGPFPTTFQRWDIGVRYRFPTAARGDWRFGAGAGYRQWRYDFDIPDEGGREVPRASYSLLRVSGDVEKWFGRFGANGAIGLMPFLGQAALGNRQSQGFAYGFEARLGIAYEILRYLRARGSLAYTGFHYPLAPLAGRNDEPGSVWDHYFTGQLTAEAVF